MPATDDLIDDVIGLKPGDALHALRRRRPEALRHAEGAFRELLLPEDPGSLTRADRALLALRVARREGDGALAARFRDLVLAGGGDPAPAEAATPAGEGRLCALLRYADAVATNPLSTTRADLEGLSALGLSSRDIVAATQLLSFVPYQIRVLAALRAMRSDAGAGGTIPAVQGPAPMRFTLKTVGWRPRLDPVKAESATPAQLAALEACPPGQRRSTYFLTLAHDPGSLGERGALFNIVMYAEGGLPRAERELATAVVSMVNGCVFCTSVHAKRFVELTGDEPAMQRILDEGWAREADPRRRAVAAFAEALTREPGGVTAAHFAPLRALGMDGIEMLDLVHSVAMFANANRLMLTLGDPLLPKVM